MLNVMPWPEHCVLAPVDGTVAEYDKVVHEYRRWAKRPGNQIEVDGIGHTIGPVEQGRPLRAEYLGRWQAVAY